MHMGPWLCFGDFNEVLLSSEKYGGRVRLEWKMSNFRKMLDFCQFKGLVSDGSQFTWSNMCEGKALIREKLDRFQFASILF